MAHETNSATTIPWPAQRRSGCPGGLFPRAFQLIAGHANPLLFPPYHVAGPVHIVGLDDQFESVGNIERAEYFKRSPDRRQASYGAADGPASAQPNRCRLQNTPSRCPAVFVHGGSIGVEFKISVNPAFPRRPVNGSLSPPASQAVGDSTWDILHRIRTTDRPSGRFEFAGMKRPPTGAAHHANTRISPIPIRVFTPAIATPRQISAGMLPDWSLICLRNTAFFHAIFPARLYQAGTAKSFRAKVQKCT
jgi:hypothetical protein